MSNKNNTKKVPADGWGLIADICHKAENNDLLRTALKKVANMNQEDLHAFLSETQMLFGRLKMRVSNIFLEPTERLIIRDFFKTKSEGGIFSYIAPGVLRIFGTEVENSPAKELAGYEFPESITRKGIIDYVKSVEIYEEVDFAHIKQICERHIIKGEKILKDEGINLFLVRDTTGQLFEVPVWYKDGWNIHEYRFPSSNMWYGAVQSFFSN